MGVLTKEHNRITDISNDVWLISHPYFEKNKFTVDKFGEIEKLIREH